MISFDFDDFLNEIRTHVTLKFKYFHSQQNRCFYEDSNLGTCETGQIFVRILNRKSLEFILVYKNDTPPP
jgi:hypothetical protein